MATKSIHKVEVDSSQFKAFYDLFKSYSAELEEIPAEWKKMRGEMGDASKSMDDFLELTASSKEALALSAAQAHVIANAISDVTKGTKDGTKAQKDFLGTLKSSSKVMKDMAKDAKTLGQEVFGIGKFLMKLGVLGLGAAGLGGVLSGLGLRDLARSAVATQRDARGIGVTPGQMQAFGTDFGRYVDSGILNRLAGAQGDMSQLPYLAMATGQSLGGAQASTPDQLAIAMMQRAHDWWNRTPAGMRNAQTMTTTGLNQFMSFEDVRRLGGMTNDEFTSAKTNYARDSRALNVSDRSTDAWFQFERQVELAGKLLKTDLTEKLSELGPNLGDFVKVITEDGKRLIDEVLTPGNIKALGDAITDMTNYLGSEQFKDAMKTFVEWLKTAARWMDVSGNKKNNAELYRNENAPSGETSSGSGKDNGGLAAYDDPAGAWSRIVNPTTGDPTLDMMNKGREGLGRAASDIGGSLSGAIRDLIAREKAHREGGVSGKQGYLDFLESRNNLPVGLLDSVWNAESSRGQRLLSPAGAKGDMGFMDPTAKQYGVDVNDFFSSAKGAGRMYSDLLAKYRGDIRKALAAYNWGAGNVDKDVAANGHGWESHLPGETQGYIKQILEAMARRQPQVMRLNVTNNTASRVSVSSHAGAIQ